MKSCYNLCKLVNIGLSFWCCFNHISW